MKTNILRRVEALAALYNHSKWQPETDLAEESPAGQYSKARESQTTPSLPTREEELLEALFSVPLVEKIRAIRDEP